MKSNIVMCFVVVFSLSFSPLQSHCRPVLSSIAANKLNDLIESTCKQSPNYNVCVSSLRSDPRSSKATDVEGLGLVMVDVLKGKAQKTLDQINDLLKQRPKPKLKQPLGYCALSYGAILNGDIPQATEAFTKGNYKFAEEGCNDAANEADLCESKFTPPASSPITRMNTAVHDVAAVTASMARILLA
ncbi:cell wall / vacuolar inhibitor of fructosidase 1-like [Humulus lupulus]|uniref:cell wall / vacuolar inhibitor of fructosidase 1-like n=1 Tax=Humulus lupulus TaxID=3486 RepID=UPI002B40E1D9|nr:cell wall / vacuolar inhibitor of fructosidase 1-like [Humulus lupulus]